MTLFRGFFPRAGSIISTMELASRLKRIGSKGAPDVVPRDGVIQVIQLIDLDDPAYAENPIWVQGGHSVTAAAAQFPSLAFVAGLRSIVDGVIISTDTGINNIVGGYTASAPAPQLCFASSRDAVNGQPTKAAASILTNSLAALPPIADRNLNTRIPADTSFWIPLQIRLVAGQAYQVIGTVAASTIHATFYGREFQE